ncbi:MAG: hypothetical protein ABW007_09920 [Chitinophagaceae bacterium]
MERLKPLPLQSASKNGAVLYKQFDYQPDVSEKIARNLKKSLVRIKKALTFAIRSKKRGVEKPERSGEVSPKDL